MALALVGVGGRGRRRVAADAADAEAALRRDGRPIPLTFVAVSALLALVAALAASVPGLRATRVDPVIALRSE